MTFRQLFTAQARADIDRLCDFLLERGDWLVADRAIRTIKAWLTSLQDFPHACRKAGDGDDPFLRELPVGFGDSGCVVLSRIGNESVAIGTVRHLREDDYH